MKSDIHPPYFQEAKIRCSCGRELVVGSTERTLSVEVCSACHPLYTGQQKLVDAAGRIDKFRKRMAAAQGMRRTGVKKVRIKRTPRRDERAKDSKTAPRT